MNPRLLLELQASQAFDDLLKAIEGVDEPLSWAVVPMKEGEYLNTYGSILTMVQHVAGCKVMYASIAFRRAEIQWRELAERYDGIGSSWDTSVAELREAHKYLTDSWSDLSADDLEKPVRHFRGVDWPVWKILSTLSHHDEYHAGQIEVLKVSLQPSSVEPPSTAEDIRQCCKDLPNW